MNSPEMRQYYQGIIDLVAKQIKAVHWKYGGKISVMDSPNFTESKKLKIIGEHQIDKVLSMDITKDYINGFTDNIVIVVRLRKQLYRDILYPNRHQCIFHLEQEQITEEESGMKIKDPVKRSHPWRMILIDPVDLGNNPSKSGSALTNDDNHHSDKDFMDIKIQLLDLVANSMMQVNVGMIAHGHVKEVTEGIIGRITGKLKTIYDNKSHSIFNGTRFLNMDLKEKESKAYTDILIPHGTAILDLPHFILKNYEGWESGAMGSYISTIDHYWYLYPLFKFYKASADGMNFLLDIHIVPKGVNPQLNRTYHLHQGLCTVVITGQVNMKESAQNENISKGEPVPVKIDVHKLHNENVHYKEAKDGPRLKGSVDEKMVENRNKKLHYEKGGVSVTNSQLQAAKDLLESGMMTVEWEYSNPHLLVPGMPVRVTYYKDNIRHKREGMLIAEQSITSLVGNFTSNRYITKTVLTLAVGKASDKELSDKRYTEGAKGANTLKRIDGFLGDTVGLLKKGLF